MSADELLLLFNLLRGEPTETEWIEFKRGNEDPEMIGKDISALANAATLNGRPAAYMVWGVEDGTHNVVGTKFEPRTARYKQQNLEFWLQQNLYTAPNFHFYTGTVGDKRFVLLEIPAALHTPVRLGGIAYIRVGPHTKNLTDCPEKARALWRLLTDNTLPFEKQVARSGVSGSDVLSLINFSAYYELTKQSLPSRTDLMLEKFASEGFVQKRPDDLYDITNYGAILFAKKLSDFPSVRRKSVRVITYTSNNRTLGEREYSADEGYAAGFERLIAHVNSQLPINEHIEQAFRVATPTYPEIVIRELVANAILHQDLTVSGTSPMVEIFTDRMEISNPGKPLITPLRFADEPPRSRNEDLAAFMRRVNICEERGSGIDKVLGAVEAYQLPAPDFAETDSATRVTLFAKREFSAMSSQERTRACYWHACLMEISGMQMTNETLRKRFGLEDSKHNQAGRIIAVAKESNLIKPHDPDNKSPRYARYVPFWA